MDDFQYNISLSSFNFFLLNSNHRCILCFPHIFLQPKSRCCGTLALCNWSRRNDILLKSEVWINIANSEMLIKSYSIIRPQIFNQTIKMPSRECQCSKVTFMVRQKNSNLWFERLRHWSKDKSQLNKVSASNNTFLNQINILFLSPVRVKSLMLIMKIMKTLLHLLSKGNKLTTVKFNLLSFLLLPQLWAGRNYILKWVFFVFRQFWPIDIFIVEKCEWYH